MLPPKEFKHIVGKAIQKFIAVKWPIEIRSSIRVGLLKFTLCKYRLAESSGYFADKRPSTKDVRKFVQLFDLPFPMSAKF